MRREDIEVMDAQQCLQIHARNAVGVIGYLLSELPTTHRQALWSALLQDPTFRHCMDKMADHAAALALRRIEAAMTPAPKRRRKRS